MYTEISVGCTLHYNKCFADFDFTKKYGTPQYKYAWYYHKLKERDNGLSTSSVAGQTAQSMHVDDKLILQISTVLTKHTVSSAVYGICCIRLTKRATIVISYLCR